MTAGRPRKFHVEQIQSLAAEGRTLREIAAHIGASYQGVAAFAAVNGTQVKRSIKIDPERVRAFAASGLTRQQVAEIIGCSYVSIAHCALANGITFARQYMIPRRGDADRAFKFQALYQAGLTLDQIGSQHGITRERVRQVLKSYGVDAASGGARVRGARNRQKQLQAKNLATQRKWGCSWDQYKHLRDLDRKIRAGRSTCERGPLRAFARQKCNARIRGIDWHLTLWQWWCLWQDSGKWDQRGRGTGYVMSRIGDEGPYALGNVIVQTGIQNSSEGTKKSDLPLGVHFNKRTNKFVAVRRQKKLGSFQSVELAQAAYLLAERSAA